MAVSLLSVLCCLLNVRMAGNGGDTYDVYEFMYRYGLPDESCQNYAAKESEKCDDMAMW